MIRVFMSLYKSQDSEACMTEWNKTVLNKRLDLVMHCRCMCDFRIKLCEYSGTALKGQIL